MLHSILKEYTGKYQNIFETSTLFSVLHLRVHNGTDKTQMYMLFSTSSQNLSITVWLAALSSTFIGQLCSRLLETNTLYLNKTPHNKKRNVLK